MYSYPVVMELSHEAIDRIIKAHEPEYLGTVAQERFNEPKPMNTGLNNPTVLDRFDPDLNGTVAQYSENLYD